MAKQIGGKINVLETVKRNMNENIEVLQKYNPSKEEIKIGASQSLSQIFSDYKDAKTSAEEYERAGLPELKKIVAVEKPKKQGLFDKFLMIVIGVAQVVVGGFLTTLSGGIAASIGTALIDSGISDVFTGVKAIINKEDINWKDWGMSKITTIGIKAIGFGIQKIGQLMKAGSKFLPKGAITKRIGKFAKGLFNCSSVIQNIFTKSKIKDDSLNNEATKRVDDAKNIIKEQWKHLFKNAGLNNYDKIEKQYFGKI